MSSLQKGITEMVRAAATRTKIKGRISPLEEKRPACYSRSLICLSSGILRFIIYITLNHRLFVNMFENILNMKF